MASLTGFLSKTVQRRGALPDPRPDETALVEPVFESMQLPATRHILPYTRAGLFLSRELRRGMTA